MADPRSMIAPPRQPLGWPTHRFQHCLKTVMPSRDVGANMTLHKNIRSELLPSSRYDKVPKRWRGYVLPPLAAYQDQYEPVQSERERQSDFMRPTVSQDNTRLRGSAQAEVKATSARSASIVLRRKKQQHPDWLVGQSLDAARLRSRMRDHTYLPGNFCTLYRPPKERIREMVHRLNYDPIERREQLILTDNPEGDAETALYTREEINTIVDRLATTKPKPEPEPEPEKKSISKELSAKEKEVVDRLSKYEHPADKEKTEEEEEEKKTVTAAELEEILTRLTKVPEPRIVADGSAPVKKVSAIEMDSILTRLTTYDELKWPPESKPEIYRLNAKQ